jgi:hypothetical protein
MEHEPWNFFSTFSHVFSSRNHGRSYGSTTFVPSTFSSSWVGLIKKLLQRHLLHLLFIS